MFWDPFDELQRMHEEMNRMFYGTLADNRMNKKLLSHEGALAKKATRTPLCHVHETENNIIATFEVPGVEKQDIDVFIEDDMIEIQVKSKNVNEQNDEQSRTYSSFSHQYQRRVPLSKEIVSSDAKATYKDGVLRIEAPKKKVSENNRRKLSIE